MNAAEIAIVFFLLGLIAGGCLGKRELDSALRNQESHARILSASVQECRAEIERLRAENARLRVQYPPRVLYRLTVTLGTVKLYGYPMSKN